MSFTTTIQSAAIESLEELYGQFTEKDFQINETKPEFEGDYTVSTFCTCKVFKNVTRKPGKKLGDLLLKKHPGLFSGYNVIKAFFKS